MGRTYETDYIHSVVGECLTNLYSFAETEAGRDKDQGSSVQNTGEKTEATNRAPEFDHLGESLKMREQLRPSYYNSHNVDFLREAGLLRGFCLGNAVKYIDRAGKKPNQPEELDLRKAKEYLEIYLLDTYGPEKQPFKPLNKEHTK